MKVTVKKILHTLMSSVLMTDFPGTPTDTKSLSSDQCPEDSHVTVCPRPRKEPKQYSPVAQPPILALLTDCSTNFPSFLWQDYISTYSHHSTVKETLSKVRKLFFS